MVVVGDVIVTKIIHKLMEIGFDYIQHRYFARDTRMKDELERLNDALPRIQAVVEMAESGQQEITGALKKWLCQLTDAVYEADDVLDELDYLKLQKQVVENASGSKEHGHCGRGKMRSFLSDSKQKVKKASKRVFKSDPILGKMRGAVKRLDEVAAGVGNFISALQLHQQDQTQSPVPARKTGPALTERKLRGRDKEMEELLEWLRKDDCSTSVSLFSITGHGEVGKTTLAQHVYNDDSLTNSFDCKIWVCISTPFVVEKVMADMIEYASESTPKVKELAALQEALKKLVSSKKILLVLDDAWNDDNRSEWDKLFAPLTSGQKGSKILLTTRSVLVAKMAASALGGSINEPMILKSLDDDNFLSLFNQYAFAGVDSCDYRKLESIGEKIAKRLGGLPLAAKTIGALLNSKLDDSHWNRILHADNISDQAQQRDGVTSVLMLSYHHLPMHLRPCFAYCSIFSQDYEFDKDDLVFMWMALGLIQKSSQYPNETLEDTGRGYFDDLVKLSFFEQDYYDEACYNMHDLLHDLARNVYDGDCFRFVGDMSINQIPNTVRHLHFETDKLDLLKDVGKRKNLRTLVLVFGGYVNKHAKAFEEAFKPPESIRVLRLDVDGMNVLPDAIGNLRHIRYLSIRHQISQLPSSFCRLYHLQVLFCRHHSSATEPVFGLNNLISLRHLMPYEYYYEKIEGIGTLTSLQRLWFAADVYKLSELKEMRDLRELKIRGLENHKHHEEVSTIELHRKRNLLVLELDWSDDSDVADEYEQMLDRLQPPDNSPKELTIRGYRGARSPCWMEPELLKNLEHVSLEYGRAWKHLPSLGKLPYLMRLTLNELPALQQINCEGGFQQLKYLSIYHCGQWEEWSGLEAEAVPWCPLLQQLFIWNCPKLKALPPLPLGLQNLVLQGVGLSDSPTFWVGSNCGGSSCGTSFSSTSSPSLSDLRIIACEELTSVAGLFRHHLTSLRELKIEYCPKMRMSPDAVTPIDCFSLPSLESLCLVDCGGSDGPTPALLMQGSPTSLLGLGLGGDNHITAFPSEVEYCRRFASLRELELAGCGELASIERLKALPHLEVLTIRECPKLVRAAAAATPASIIKREEEQGFTSTVEELEIDDPFLLHVEPLRKLTSVRRLEIGDGSHLEAALAEPWLLQNSTSLRSLHLWRTAKTLPSSLLQTLSSLEDLTLTDARELQSLPQLPFSLRQLRIRYCNEALKERCRENEGADWPNIQHIPRIDID